MYNKSNSTYYIGCGHEGLELVTRSHKYENRTNFRFIKESGSSKGSKADVNADVRPDAALHHKTRMLIYSNDEITEYCI